MKREQKDTFTEQPVCSVHVAGHCITCGDEALYGRVLQLDPVYSTALVEIEGTCVEVDISLVDAVAPGDLLLIHGGVAIGVDSGSDKPEDEVRDVHS
jgi:hydrogenase maturation factor